jgi:hypothetical protein
LRTGDEDFDHRIYVACDHVGLHDLLRRKPRVRAAILAVARRCSCRSRRGSAPRSPGDRPRTTSAAACKEAETQLPFRNLFRSDYFKSGCEQLPSPNARETRPPRGRVFRFLRSVFEGWSRVAGHPVSRGLNHGVARLPRWPTGWAESLSGSLAWQGAGLRLGRSRWSGHYPRGRARWGGGDGPRNRDRSRKDSP